jgi:hypothetical protein
MCNSGFGSVKSKIDSCFVIEFYYDFDSAKGESNMVFDMMFSNHMYFSIELVTHDKI